MRASNGQITYLFDVPDEQMMAKENQAVTGELARLGAERDENRRKLGDALHLQATSEQVCIYTHAEKLDRIGKGVPDSREICFALILGYNIESLLIGNTVPRGHSKWDQLLLVNIGEYIGFCVYRRSCLLWSPVIVHRGQESGGSAGLVTRCS